MVKRFGSCELETVLNLTWKNITGNSHFMCEGVSSNLTHFLLTKKNLLLSNKKCIVTTPVKINGCTGVDMRQTVWGERDEHASVRREVGYGLDARLMTQSTAGVAAVAVTDILLQNEYYLSNNSVKSEHTDIKVSDEKDAPEFAWQSSFFHKQFSSLLK